MIYTFYKLEERSTKLPGMHYKDGLHLDKHNSNSARVTLDFTIQKSVAVHRALVLLCMFVRQQAMSQIKCSSPTDLCSIFRGMKEKGDSVCLGTLGT